MVVRERTEKEKRTARGQVCLSGTALLLAAGVFLGSTAPVEAAQAGVPASAWAQSAVTADDRAGVSAECWSDAAQKGESEKTQTDSPAAEGEEASTGSPAQAPSRAGTQEQSDREKNDEVEIPESLLDFAQKYPEAEAFVRAYPQEHNRTHSYDLSKEIRKGEIPLFIQWDKRWGYTTYGGDFFAVTACGPTCLSMVACGLSGSARWTPVKVAAYADEAGYYVPGSGSSWSLMSEGAAHLGLSSFGVGVSDSAILNTLKNDHPIIASMTPGDFTTAGHFIVLRGVDREGKVLVNDPNSRINSKKHWDVSTLTAQMRAAWGFSLQED